MGQRWCRKLQASTVKNLSKWCCWWRKRHYQKNEVGQIKFGNVINRLAELTDQIQASRFQWVSKYNEIDKVKSVMFDDISKDYLKVDSNYFF